MNTTDPLYDAILQTVRGLAALGPALNTPEWKLLAGLTAACTEYESALAGEERRRLETVRTYKGHKPDCDLLTPGGMLRCTCGKWTESELRDDGPNYTADEIAEAERQQRDREWYNSMPGAPK